MPRFLNMWHFRWACCQTSWISCLGQSLWTRGGALCLHLWAISSRFVFASAYLSVNLSVWQNYYSIKLSFQSQAIRQLVSGDLVTRQLVSENLDTRQLVSGNLVTRQLVSGNLATRQLVSGNLATRQLVSGSQATRQLVSDSLATCQLVSDSQATRQLVSASGYTPACLR